MACFKLINSQLLHFCRGQADCPLEPTDLNTAYINFALQDTAGPIFITLGSLITPARCMQCYRLRMQIQDAYLTVPTK